jgi:two-component system, OmpR family, response regulator TctD
MRILLVEDSPELAEWLGRLLRKSRFVVDCIHDGIEADEALKGHDYALVILDLELPGIGGIEVLRRLRARNRNVPVIILTANDTVSSRISGLDGGADDYLVKPFDPFELEARIRARLRRSQDPIREAVRFGSLELDVGTRGVTLAGADLTLTGREHGVLEALMLACGRVVPKAALIEAIYGFDDTANQSAIEIYIHRLRKRLEGTGISISTLRGLGYALKQDQIGQGDV